MIKEIIRTIDLNKTFGDIKVLKNINISVNEGSVVSIIGPSGSGKSTLLRSIIGLEEITSGKIIIENKDISSNEYDEETKKNILLKMGMVFQNFNLFPHMTVGNNIIKTLQVVKKFNELDARKKAIEVLTVVGLENKIDNYPSELSGGQKQRVAIARALAMEPDILLFDEPTSALDPELVKEVLDIIKKLKDKNITMLIVSHEMKFVKDISDKVIVMEDGIVIEEGTSSDIFENSKVKRVQQFLDSEY